VAPIADDLQMVVQPANTFEARFAMSQQPQVEARVGATRDTDDNTTQITMSVFSGGGVLTGTTTETVSSGLATFTNVAYSITASSVFRFTSDAAHGTVDSDAFAQSDFIGDAGINTNANLIAGYVMSIDYRATDNTDLLTIVGGNVSEFINMAATTERFTQSLVGLRVPSPALNKFVEPDGTDDRYEPNAALIAGSLAQTQNDITVIVLATAPVSVARSSNAYVLRMADAGTVTEEVAAFMFFTSTDKMSVSFERGNAGQVNTSTAQAGDNAPHMIMGTSVRNSTNFIEDEEGQTVGGATTDVVIGDFVAVGSSATALFASVTGVPGNFFGQGVDNGTYRVWGVWIFDADVRSSFSAFQTELENEFVITMGVSDVASMAMVADATSGTAEGATLSTMTVELLDSGASRLTSDNSTEVTVSIFSEDAPGSPVLSGTLVQTASSGLATFDDLSLDIAGNYVLQYLADDATTNTVSFSIVAADALNMVVQPSTTLQARFDMSTQPEVEVLVGGVRDTGDNSTIITAAKQSGAGTLSGTLTATVSSGLATFTDLQYSDSSSLVIRFTSSGTHLLVDAASFTQDDDLGDNDVFTNADLLWAFVFRNDVKAVAGHNILTLDAGNVSEWVATNDATIKATQGTPGNRVADPGSTQFVTPGSTDRYTGNAAMQSSIDGLADITIIVVCTEPPGGAFEYMFRFQGPGSTAAQELAIFGSQNAFTFLGDTSTQNSRDSTVVKVIPAGTPDGNVHMFGLTSIQNASDHLRTARASNSQSGVANVAMGNLTNNDQLTLWGDDRSGFTSPFGNGVRRMYMIAAFSGDHRGDFTAGNNWVAEIEAMLTLSGI